MSFIFLSDPKSENEGSGLVIGRPALNTQQKNVMMQRLYYSMGTELRTYFNHIMDIAAKQSVVIHPVINLRFSEKVLGTRKYANHYLI